MRDDIDIERTLKQFESDSGPALKRSIVDRYARKFDARRGARDRTGFWRRPVPLYAAAAGLVVAVALSFLVGQRTAAPSMPEAFREPARVSSLGAVPELTWEPAPNDFLRAASSRR